MRPVAALGFCVVVAVSRYPSRLPCTSWLRIGKSRRILSSSSAFTTETVSGILAAVLIFILLPQKSSRSPRTFCRRTSRFPAATQPPGAPRDHEPDQGACDRGTRSRKPATEGALPKPHSSRAHEDRSARSRRLGQSWRGGCTSHRRRRFP